MPDCMYAGNLPRFGIFGEIEFIKVKDILQNRIKLRHPASFKHRRHGLRHSAGDLIAPVFRLQLVEYDFRKLPDFFQTVDIVEGRWIGGPQELPERYREHPHHPDLAHRHRHASPFHGHAQKRACRDHMVFRRILAKILEAVQGLFAFLDFVEDNQRLPWNDRNVGIERQLLDQPGWVFRVLEYGLELRLAVKIEHGAVVETSAAELFHNPRFPYLPGTFQQDRLSVRRVSPALQLLKYVPLYVHSLALNCSEKCAFRHF